MDVWNEHAPGRQGVLEWQSDGAGYRPFLPETRHSALGQTRPSSPVPTTGAVALPEPRSARIAGFHPRAR